MPSTLTSLFLFHNRFFFYFFSDTASVCCFGVLDTQGEKKNTSHGGAPFLVFSDHKKTRDTLRSTQNTPSALA
jgi:hypothetical protein